MTDNNEDREICVWTYWVRPEREEEFVELLAENWAVLRRLGFVTEQRPFVLRSSEEPPVYVEILEFEAAGMRPAHEHPDVIPVWEALKPLVEERREDHNVPGMSFPLYRRVELVAEAPSDARG